MSGDATTTANVFKTINDATGILTATMAKTNTTVMTTPLNHPTTAAVHMSGDATTTANVFKTTKDATGILTATMAKTNTTVMTTPLNHPTTDVVHMSGDATTTANVFKTINDATDTLTATMAKTNTTVMTTPLNHPTTAADHMSGDATTTVNVFKTTNDATGILTATMAKTNTTVMTTPLNHPTTAADHMSGDATTTANVFKTTKGATGILTATMAKMNTTVMTTPLNHPTTAADHMSGDATTTANVFKTTNDATGILTATMAKTNTTVMTTPLNHPTTAADHMSGDATTTANVFKTTNDATGILTATTAKMNTTVMTTPPNHPTTAADHMSGDATTTANVFKTTKDATGILTATTAKMNTTVLVNIVYKKNCRSYEWRCYYNGQCIQDYQRCNGYSDCYYGEDEYNCYDYTTEPSYYGCRSYEWRCYYNGQCIQDYQRCNGYSDCYYGEDEYNCYGNTVAPTVDVNPPSSVVRLVNGITIYEGRVEMFVEGSWVTFCGYTFNWNAANVVCRQLGYQNVISVSDYGAYGQGVGNNVNVNCHGLESSILDCRFDPVYNCRHILDAGVNCSGPDTIRLVNGGSSNEGRVEVLYQDEWGTVCDDGWDLNDANVVCRMLYGYPSASNAWSSAHFGQGSGRIMLDDVNCQGNESSLAECQHRGWLSHDCGHGEDAGVTCERGIRLVNGNTIYEGRVEVIVDGVWGTVCDVDWNWDDADVACRQLGYGPVWDFPSDSRYGQGVGPIHFSRVDCVGWESSIFKCPTSDPEGCFHLMDANLICQAPPYPTTDSPFDHATEPSYYHDCRPYQWQCYIGQCIQSYERCDGFSNCFFGEDEYDCKVCSASLWLCYNSSQCIQDYERCDGFEDCYYGEDEFNCNEVFQCDNGDEIPMRYTCDRIVDCLYAEDEWRNCEDNDVKRDNIDLFPRREQLLSKDQEQNTDDQDQ
ncbi:uncharacterized protein LOC119732362 [Patiria miniata]|uniref:SRCR domain-containing protein n=1 Tax=Patiria miniata TaxID=46514 RepID=A0A914ADD3_PATMI|nr:uncharacterized protein LOC119732362 [Patiria miniata]